VPVRVVSQLVITDGRKAVRFVVYGIVANASFQKKEVASHDGTSSYEGLYNEIRLQKIPH
jgi:hypothetical protein